MTDIKRLSNEEQKLYKDSIFPIWDHRWNVNWEDICNKAKEKGDEIFLSNSYKKLPHRYQDDFILRLVKLDELNNFTSGGYKFAIQVSRRQWYEKRIK